MQPLTVISIRYNQLLFAHFDPRKLVDVQPLVSLNVNFPSQPRLFCLMLFM